MSKRHQTPPPPPPGHEPDLAHQPAYAPPAEPKKKSWFARHKILTGILAVLVLGGIINALGDDEPTAPAATTQTSSEPAHASGEEGAGSSAASQGTNADESAADETEEASAEETTDAVEEEPAEEAAPGLNDVVTVGDFEVTITGVETGIASVGPDGWGEDAQGQFVKISATVKNTGNSAEMFFDSEQKLIDEQDREHSTSSASIYLDEGNLWLTDINPGNTATGVLLFDIPVDSTPVTLKVSSGFLGDTAEVSLGG